MMIKTIAKKSPQKTKGNTPSPPPEEIKLPNMSLSLDIGNSLCRAIDVFHPEIYMLIPHAVKPISENTVAEMRENGNIDMRVFCYEGQWYMTGEIAESSGALTRRSGGEKYTKNYYTVLFLALMLGMFPNGYNALSLVATFPPSDIDFLPDLSQCLLGKHKVELLNRKTVSYKVTYLRTLYEPLGGLYQFALASNGENFQEHITEKMKRSKILTVDIGGVISNGVPVMLNNWVGVERARSIDLGILSVMARVSRDIKRANKELFRSHRGTNLPFDERMRNALLTHVYEAGGRELDVSEFVSDAVLWFCRQFRDFYVQELGGASEWDAIVISGGGGGLLYEALIEHVLDFPIQHVHTATVRENMHLANALGAGKAFIPIIQGRTNGAKKG